MRLSWLFLLGACAFDASVPADVVVVCQSDVDCPDSMLCSSDIGRCINAESCSDETPELSDVSIAPMVAGLGTAVMVELTSSIALAQAPSVYLDTEPPPYFTVTETGATSYSAEYVVNGSEPEGTFTVSTDLTDTCGNTTTIELGTLTIDF